MQLGYIIILHLETGSANYITGECSRDRTHLIVLRPRSKFMRPKVMSLHKAANRPRAPYFVILAMYNVNAKNSHVCVLIWHVLLLESVGSLGR